MCLLLLRAHCFFARVVLRRQQQLNAHLPPPALESLLHVNRYAPDTQHAVIYFGTRTH